jgi:hypothetical protein
MNAITYNASMAAGLALIGAGVGMVSVPAAMVVVGGLVIGLTLTAAFLSRKG